ncbi:MAG: hypothetical protein ACXWCZ_09060 [Flavisolibacter sp.]
MKFDFVIRLAAVSLSVEPHVNSGLTDIPKLNQPPWLMKTKYAVFYITEIGRESWKPAPVLDLRQIIYDA